MNDNSGGYPRKKLANKRPVCTDSELEGFVKLGMKREVFQLVRQTLRLPEISAEKFNEALNALLTLGDKLKTWTKLVESAYGCLPKREQALSRFYMISFRSAVHDHEGVLRLMPRQFVGDFALAELAFVMEAAFALDRKEITGKLAKRLPRWIQQADYPVMQAHLMLCLAEFCAQEGRWDETIALAEAVQNCEMFDQNAVVSIVEIHVARALLALQNGLRLVEQFKKNFDPETELFLPGNDKAIQEDAKKEFKRLQKILEKVVSQTRQKELGLSGEQSKTN